MDFNLIYTIGHLFGVAIGAGGAYLSDFMFMQSIRDRKISATEFKFMSLGSKFVWVGLGLLFVSGLGLFSTDPQTYLTSSKFQTKMAIVAILTINGLIFLLVHMPRIKRHQGSHYPSSDEFRRKAPWLLLSGVISVTSWTSAIILGGLRSIPYTFTQGLIGYLAVIVIGFVIALAIKNKLLFSKR